MNPDTGHLVDTREFEKEDFQKLMTQGYVPVPEELEKAAEIKLNGKSDAYVSKTSGGKLSKFNASKRKAKRRQQKRSRKNNR